jgi:hypothetical protein
MPNTTTRPAPGPHPTLWNSILLALGQADASAGSDAAGWWAQDTVGGRAGGDTATRARAVLAGINDGDPAVLDALPTCDLSGQGPTPQPEPSCTPTPDTGHRLLATTAAGLRDQISATSPDHLYQYVDQLAEVCALLTQTGQAREERSRPRSGHCHAGRHP